MVVTLPKEILLYKPGAQKEDSLIPCYRKIATSLADSFLAMTDYYRLPRSILLYTFTPLYLSPTNSLRHRRQSRRQRNRHPQNLTHHHRRWLAETPWRCWRCCGNRT